MAGLYFTLPRETGANRHPFVIISDPVAFPDDVVMSVNFTEADPDKDLTCVVTPAECKYLSKVSCIFYEVPGIAPLALFRTFPLQARGVVSPQVLTRIREGMMDSDDAHREHKDILIRQRLVAPRE